LCTLRISAGRYGPSIGIVKMPLFANCCVARLCQVHGRGLCCSWVKKMILCIRDASFLHNEARANTHRKSMPNTQRMTMPGCTMNLHEKLILLAGGVQSENKKTQMSALSAHPRISPCGSTFICECVSSSKDAAMLVDAGNNEDSELVIKAIKAEGIKKTGLCCGNPSSRGP